MLRVATVDADTVFDGSGPYKHGMGH